MSILLGASEVFPEIGALDWWYQITISSVTGFTVSYFELFFPIQCGLDWSKLIGETLDILLLSEEIIRSARP
jgi:hypothetical protein